MCSLSLCTRIPLLSISTKLKHVDCSVILSQKLHCVLPTITTTLCDKRLEYKHVGERRITVPLRAYSKKAPLTLQWVRPPKIPSTDPQKSGDLKPVPPINMQDVSQVLQQSEELKDANELVKRVLSLEFAKRYDVTQFIIQEMINSVKPNEVDESSEEVKIAKMTARIRCMQQKLAETPKDVRTKVKLKECIDKRKKKLKLLRREDYKKFEWLLEKLDICYKASPEEHFRVTRKDSLRRLHKKYSEDIIQKRIEAHKQTLEEQKEDFLKEKIEKLKWIREEEMHYGLETTVNENDIDNVVKQLEDLRMSRDKTEDKSMNIRQSN